MSILSEVRAMVEPLIADLQDMLLRAVVKRTKETTKLRELQLEVLADDADDEVEHVEAYGWSSRPLADAEAILANLGADADQVVALVVFDRRHRPTTLKEGEVIVYDNQSQYVHLTNQGWQGRDPCIVVEADKIQLGLGANTSVARAGDSVSSDATIDTPFWAWVTAVATATSTSPPSTLASQITSGSSVVKAVD